MNRTYYVTPDMPLEETVCGHRWLPGKKYEVIEYEDHFIIYSDNGKIDYSISVLEEVKVLFKEVRICD